MTIERRHITAADSGIEVRSNEDGSKTIVGYAAVYYQPGDAGTEFALRSNLVERIMPGAFDAAVASDDVRGLYNHDTALVLGRTGAGTLRLSVDARGLRYEIDLPDTTTGRDLAVSLERRDITGSSFGFTVDKDGQAFAKEGEKNVRHITAIGKLYDVGPVTFPAYAGTSAATRDDSVIDAELAKIDAEMQAASDKTRQRQASKRAKRIRARLVEISE